MISTPYTAYKWCLEEGLDRDQATQICQQREKFEYFVAVLKAIYANHVHAN